jgi:predicted patatin/cPLA2 family phospholipase
MIEKKKGDGGMKTLVMLEGGSYRGVYTSGVLDVWMGENIYPDCVVGVSAGALNGMCYVAKQPGRCRDIVLNYGLDPRYVGTKALRHEHNLVGFDFILRETRELFPFDEDTFFHGGVDFYAAVTSCATGQQEYISRDGPDDIYAAIAASSSMPFLCRRVTVGDGQYLDGGIGTHLPLGFWAQYPEYDRVVAVLTRRLDYRKKPYGKAVTHLARRLYGDSPQLLETVLGEAERYAQEREELARLEQDGKLLIIQPETELPISRLERDMEKLRAGYETGRQAGVRSAKRVKEWLGC